MNTGDSCFIATVHTVGANLHCTKSAWDRKNVTWKARARQLETWPNQKHWTDMLHGLNRSRSEVDGAFKVCTSTARERSRNSAGSSRSNKALDESQSWKPCRKGVCEFVKPLTRPHETTSHSPIR